MTDHIPEILSWYRSETPGTETNLARLLNHGISRRATPNGPSMPAPSWQRLVREQILGQGLFTQRYAFPDGELMPVSAVNLAAE